MLVWPCGDYAGGGLALHPNVAESLELFTIHDARLQRLFAYWQGKHHGDLLPGRADIDPVEMKPFLTVVYLVDVLANDQFRYRLLGTEIVNRAGRDMTGQLLSPGTHGRTFEPMRAIYREAIARKAMAFSRRARPRHADDRALRADGLVLPLASDGRTVDMLMGGLSFGSAPAFSFDTATEPVHSFGWVVRELG
ncbi:MAG TPA: PAS domain-containing protein [Caulobacter sp.]|nr:PAS domain-containing protein [Caulobacter sp.]